MQFASVQNDMVRLKQGAAACEDGTANFLAMPAVCEGLRWITEVGISQIARPVADLTAMLIGRLGDRGDGVVVYGPRDGHARVRASLACPPRLPTSTGWSSASRTLPPVALPGQLDGAKNRPSRPADMKHHQCRAAGDEQHPGS